MINKNENVFRNMSIALFILFKACAPKFTHFKLPSDDYHYPIGACYLTSDFLNDESPTYTYLPCVNRLGAEADGQSFGFCQAGLSATFLKVSAILSSLY